VELIHKFFARSIADVQKTWRGVWDRGLQERLFRLTYLSMDRETTPRRSSLDAEPLSLGRRAAYRRLLALLGSQERPWVIGGAMGLSLQLGRLVDGQLEIFMLKDDVPEPLNVTVAAGIKVERDDAHGFAKITYGDHRAILRWALPSPLLGEVDRDWLSKGKTTRFLGIRVQVAPIEELLWLRMAGPSAASVSDPLIGQLLLHRGASLDWDRLTARMAGLEALLLAHIFLFWHQYPESARAVVPERLLGDLTQRLHDLEEQSVLDSLLEPQRVEQSLAEQSLHGRG
jgi:hypothetical protein